MTGKDRGVFVATDEVLEWLLPWWWGNYSETNKLPVCFGDFFMSDRATTLFQARGLYVLISLEHLRMADKERIGSARLQEWEKNLSPFWGSRGAWFKKPFGMLASPFEETLWMDLDCEVMGAIEPVFEHLKSSFCLMKLREEGKKVLYNSGVVVFRKGSPVLPVYADYAMRYNHKFLGDQDALSELIYKKKFQVDSLPDIYNWQMCRGLNIAAKILHWTAGWGKEYIRRY